MNARAFDRALPVPVRTADDSSFSTHVSPRVTS
jgi:hypothetical protein